MEETNRRENIIEEGESVDISEHKGMQDGE